MILYCQSVTTMEAALIIEVIISARDYKQFKFEIWLEYSGGRTFHKCWRSYGTVCVVSQSLGLEANVLVTCENAKSMLISNHIHCQYLHTYISALKMLCDSLWLMNTAWFTIELPHLKHDLHCQWKLSTKNPGLGSYHVIKCCWGNCV